MKRDYETAATVELTTRDGEVLRLSAILHRDPQHLHWNRIRLLGTEQEKLSLWKIDNDHDLEWSLFMNARWPPMGAEYRTSGRGGLRDRGMTQGMNIDPEGVQAFSEIDVYETVETIGAEGWSEQRADYWFLQRPYDWFASRRRYREPKGLSRHGDWLTLRSLGLKFRLAQIGHPRSDDRLSKEVELVDIPAVEIKPLTSLDQDDFVTRADDLWFSLRILIAFRYRQYVSQLMEYKEGSGRRTQTWHLGAIEPKEKRPDADTPPFYGNTARIFARALPALARYRAQRELLHGAVYGYAESFKTSISESHLTSCVEGLERLVCAFEEIKGLSRDTVERKAWRPIAKALKRAIDEADVDAQTRGRLKRSLSSPALLSLQERLERMATTYRRYWSEQDRALLAGIGKLIKVRNDIVHGRLITDYNALYVELVRGRALFERLFLNLVGCHTCDLPGYAYLVVFDADQPPSAAQEPLA